MELEPRSKEIPKEAKCPTDHPNRNLNARKPRKLWPQRPSNHCEVCASHVAPRALPPGCSIGKQLLRESTAMFIRQRSLDLLRFGGIQEDAENREFSSLCKDV